MRKRIVSSILSLILVVSMLIPSFPVYAKMTSHNTAGGAGSASKEVIGPRNTASLYNASCCCPSAREGGFSVP